MDSKTIQHLSSSQLKKMLQFRKLALTILIMGVSIGLMATFIRLKADGILPWETGVVSILALLAGLPVYFEYKRIENTLSERQEG